MSTDRSVTETQQFTTGNVALKRLEARLDDGYARIEAAEARGEDIETLEAFWFKLLDRYEVLADDLRRAA